ncbi:MAG TPA: hypothetical protein PKX46_08770 [Clostridia bacterium]|nr:hypothetical protein [Clostridia bacterium]
MSKQKIVLEIIRVELAGTTIFVFFGGSNQRKQIVCQPTLTLSKANLLNAANQSVMRQRSFESTQHCILPDTVTARNAINSASHEFLSGNTIGNSRNVQRKMIKYDEHKSNYS